MDEYLSEKEQIEQIKQWWNDYGWFLLGGAAVAALGIYGWNQYQAWVDRQGERAAALYFQLREAVEDDRDNQLELLANLREAYPASPYADQAALLIAEQLIVRDPARAAAELRVVMDESDDAELALTARLRLARVLAYQEQFDEALDVLDVEGLGPFAASAASIRGDVHAARGDSDAARMEYSRALSAPGSENLDRNLLQIKLNALQPAASGTAADEDSA